MSILPRCGRHGIYSAAAVTWRASGPNSEPPSRILTVSTICRRLARSWPYKANREGVADPFPDPSVRKTIAVDVSLIDPYDNLLGEVDLYLRRSAKGHGVQTFARLHSVPGIGQILALVLLYEIQDSARFPRVQDFVSSCRLVKCAKESNHNRLGTSGKKNGNVHLRWAFAEAAALFLRHTQPGKAYFTNWNTNTAKPKRSPCWRRSSRAPCITCCRGSRRLTCSALSPRNP